MTEEEALQLRKEQQDRREAWKQTQERLRVARARIEELEKPKTPPPTVVKADVKKPAPAEKKPRKKRALQPPRARRRALPTEFSVIDQCKQTNPTDKVALQSSNNG